MKVTILHAVVGMTAGLYFGYTFPDVYYYKIRDYIPKRRIVKPPKQTTG
jgi:hypothetical protein